MDRRHLLKSSLLLLAAPAAQAQPAREAKPDPAPLDNELDKHPRCAQCGMDRRMFHRTRHLIQFEDGATEGTCSIHCVAISLVHHLPATAQAVWAADFGAAAEPRPLVPADKAGYLIGGNFPPVMSRRPKTAFASVEAARVAQAGNGGELADFDQALVASYADLVDVMKQRRRRRAERPRREG
jgi:nitrous oxide reductase accessory protein NosL